MRTLLAAAVAAASVLSLAAEARAWSHKEHIQLTRLAVTRIIADPAAPEDLKTWLKANTELLPSMEAEREWFLKQPIGEKPEEAGLKGMLWWVVVPDLEANERSKRHNGAFDNPEMTSHFIDLEFANPAGPKRQYADDLSSLPSMEAFKHDVGDETYKRGGYLPFARENAYRKLIEAIKAGKLAADPAKPEDQDHAVRWAAFLAHYTEDNTQPQHATADFKSASYFKGMKNAPNVHAEVEYRMNDDAKQSDDVKTRLEQVNRDYWDAFAAELKSVSDPVETDDLFRSTLEVSIASYKALPMIGKAAAASLKQPAGAKPEIDTATFFTQTGTFDGKQQTVLQMKAHQTAWAVARVQRVLVQAWKEAKQN